MSDFVRMMCDMLPVSSELSKSDNELHNVLDKSLGEYMDNQDEVLEQLFVSSATGGWLDAHGRDYGVIRKVDETDEDYRTRIIQEKNDKLVPSFLNIMYGLTLYIPVTSFDATDNDLTSDNPYITTSSYMSIASDEIKAILAKKFVLNGEITWL